MKRTAWDLRLGPFRIVEWPWIGFELQWLTKDNEFKHRFTWYYRRYGGIKRHYRTKEESNGKS